MLVVTVHVIIIIANYYTTKFTITGLSHTCKYMYYTLELKQIVCYSNIRFITKLSSCQYQAAMVTLCSDCMCILMHRSPSFTYVITVCMYFFVAYVEFVKPEKEMVNIVLGFLNMFQWIFISLLPIIMV